MKLKFRVANTENTEYAWFSTKNVLNGNEIKPTTIKQIPIIKLVYFFIKKSSYGGGDYKTFPTPALPGSGTVDSITQSPLSQVNLAPTYTLKLFQNYCNYF